MLIGRLNSAEQEFEQQAIELLWANLASFILVIRQTLQQWPGLYSKVGKTCQFIVSVLELFNIFFVYNSSVFYIQSLVLMTVVSVLTGVFIFSLTTTRSNIFYQSGYSDTKWFIIF